MTENTGIHIGLTPWDWRSISTAKGVAAQARTAEQLGFDSFWVPESHFAGKRSIPAPLLLLAAAAAATDTITLGCVSYLLPIRNATLAAEEIAVLDLLCEGRLILGLGRGIQPQMFEAFAIDAADKRKLFAERLEEIRELWAGGVAPLPLQQPEPRLWAAAIGPKALGQIAGLGLPYLASPLETFDTLAANLATYRSTADKVASAVTPIMRTVFITDSTAQAQQLKQALGKQLAASGRQGAGQLDQVAIIGPASFVQAQLERYRTELGMTHLILRGGLPGIEASAQVASFSAVREMYDAIHR